MRKIAILLAALLLCAGLAGCADQSASATAQNGGADDSFVKVQQAGKLVLGLDDAFPPMGFRDEDNNLVGFDIDLAQAVCDELGVKLECQPIDWNSKEQELNTGKIDCIWNGMSINEERKAQMNLSQPYLDNHMALVVRTGEGIASPADMAGKKLGIIGLGAIGVKVANAAVGLDMEVWGYDPYLSVDGALKLDRSVKHVTELDEIFANCDYITIHVPLNADTKNTISAEAIEKMKDGVRVINLARGELVDTKAMAKALESGKVAAYVSDFASDEILEQENAITLPHLGASTPESEDNCAKMAVYEITEYLEKGTIRNSVNFPNLKVPYEGGYRICMIHRNIPNMIASITAAVKCNIENMGNRSRGDYAYTIVDAAEQPTEANLEALRAIDGMISVRTI